MTTNTISYEETGYFSKLICDYLAEDTALTDFYGRFPKLENFKRQIEAKKETFTSESRNALVEQLKTQYKSFKISEATQQNIELLSEENTFTITTGHQLNLFTGPLYFLYKIFSVINLSEALKEKYPMYDFVPVYWMATEDHDFDEINYFNYQGKKITWNHPSGGAVGEFSTEGLQEVAEQLAPIFGESEHGKHLHQLFTEAYLNHDNLADATRYLGNELFKKHGLVIVDGNDAVLKKAFIPYAEKELTQQQSYKKVTESTNRLVDFGYAEQVHPREINLFYLAEGVRERIVEVAGSFYVNETKIEFTKDALLRELQEHPERFSPNALLRPLYQEVILPNLCYVGGGGELAYWFQLKDYFESVAVPFPMLLLRNSALLVSQKSLEKLQKLGVSVSQLFQKQTDLKTEHTHELSEIEIDFSTQRAHLQQQFKELYAIAEKTDASFIGAVAAQEKKQLNGLDHLEKRLLKAQKRKLADQLERLTDLQDALFPKQSLQERNTNFSEYYVVYGNTLLNELKRELNPLQPEFTIVTL
ncbi:MAG: bacillithiol biosynthesis cysteine-adding enzyme BshC [Flavobacteriaceae bacterium]|nr:bacillithiol biosynthesis cysteine-adding enzyme BshC [Flavobacteriaceae bacterium]|tara:strand:+ start:4281 stop:5876 length:1596 start_codon:yes stop_codon:yes gene_type:complete